MSVFKQIKQVKAATFAATPDEDKIGILWLVRNVSGDTSDLYFGTRHYGHVGPEKTELYELLKGAGIVDASGNPINVEELISGVTMTEGDGIEITEDNVINANTNAKTTEDIQVTVDLGAGITKDTTIPAGTSVQELLVKLLSKELWSATPTTGKTFNATIGAPNISVSPNVSKAEIGDEISVTATTNTTYSIAQSVNAGTFEYGYSDDAKATHKANTSYSETLTPTKSGSEDMSMTFTKFNSHTAMTLSEGATTISTKANVEEGNNVISTSETGKTVTAATSVTQKDFYVATNLKHYTKSATDQSDWIVSIPATWNGTASITPKNSSSKTVAGYYRFYYGYIANQNDFSESVKDTAGIKALDNNQYMEGSTFTITTMTSVEGRSAMAIAIPATWEITATKNSLGAPVDVATTWIKIHDVDYTNGNKTTKYSVYVNGLASPATYQEIKIDKK